MRRMMIICAAAALLVVASSAEQAMARHGGARNRVADGQSQGYPWHGAYYDVAWGTPVAVLVPPTAESQAHLGWGVGATRVTPIAHQFQYSPGYPGPAVLDRPGFLPTPRWPSSTDQFGDYYIRGPW